MPQIFRTWSTNQGGTCTPIEVLATTPIIAMAAPLAIMTPGTGRAQPDSSNILPEKESDSAQAIRTPIALLAQRR
jgi:hypothetical protein